MGSLKRSILFIAFSFLLALVVLIGTNKTLASGVQALATLFIGTTPIVGGTNTNCLNITAGKLGQQACSSSGSIAHTTNALVGDGAGNASAAGGTGTNCLLVNGGNASCGGGSSFTPVTALHSWSGDSVALLGAVTFTDFTANNVIVVGCDSFGISAEPTFSDTASTTWTKVPNGQFSGNIHLTAFVGAPNNSTDSGTCGWQVGAANTKLTAFELPISLVTVAVDGSGGITYNLPSGNVGSGFTYTTTANDITVSFIDITQNATSIGLCHANGVPVAANAGASATSGTTVCIGAAPQAVTNFPGAPVGTVGAQAAAIGFAIKHQ